MSDDRALLLAGIDGGNPLGFLAALGTLRVLEAAHPRRRWRMSWTREPAGWRPRIHAAERPTAGEVVAWLAEYLPTTSTHPAFSLGNDLKATPEEYRSYAGCAAAAASSDDRSWADFASAFACEAVVDARGKQPLVRDTAFRTMSGAGHQHFLAFMRNILASVEAPHLRSTLFSVWTYDDPLENATLRWDPTDDVRYALRWRDPSGDPARKRGGSMLGANALAIHALPLFPVAPIGRRLVTTGFRGRGARDTEWTWPIWAGEAPLDVVRSLLTASELQKDEPRRAELARQGVVEVYRSRRITTGKFRNFTPAEPV